MTEKEWIGIQFNWPKKLHLVFKANKNFMQFFSIILFSIFFFFNPTIIHGQSNDDTFQGNFSREKDVSLDIFPLGGCMSFGFPVSKKITVGINGSFSTNFSNIVLLAGKRLGKSNTPFLYEEMDEYDSGRYISLYGAGVFTRLFYDQKMPLELGLKAEYFFHSVVSPNEEDVNVGFYNAPYLKVFFPSKFKYDDDEKKRKPSFGIETSFGKLKFQRYRAEDEWAVMLAFWMRLDMNWNDL